MSRYHFRIDYRQGKANAAADALSQYLQRSPVEEKLLRNENIQILHRLQSLLTNATLLGLSISPSSLTLSPLYQVLICGTYVLSQLLQFWNTLRSKLTNKGPYKASIGGMRLRFQELQEEDDQAKEIRADKPEGWEESDRVLQHQGLPYVPEIIRTKLVSRHHDDLLAGHFGIEKTGELLARKYYWPSLHHDVEDYIKGCDVCLASKAVRHKSYGDL